MGYEAYCCETKAISKYPACVDAVKCGVLYREKHEVGYATGSHAIMRRSQENSNTSSRSHVFCQAVATRLAAKFAVVRAGRYYEAGLDSYTPLMVEWQRRMIAYMLSIHVLLNTSIRGSPSGILSYLGLSCVGSVLVMSEHQLSEWSTMMLV